MDKKEDGKHDGAIGCGCLLIILIAIFAGILFGIRSCNRNADLQDDQQERVTEKSSSKETSSDSDDSDSTESDDDSDDEFELKDSQKAISNDLYSDSDLNQLISKIKYRGDGEAEVEVAASFVALTRSERNTVAHKVSNLVLSDAEDDKDADTAAFLTFIYKGNLIGHSGYVDRSVYKWKD